MIAILTACFGRNEIFSLFLNSIPKENYLICVGDEGINQDLFCEYKVNRGMKGEYLVHENNPLGKKWNHGLQLARKFPFEYLVITGSDDFFCPDLWNWYKTLNVHYAGLLDIYFLEHTTGKIKYNNGFIANRRGEPHGAGRAIHRSVLDAADWKLWDDEINIGLDASLTKTLSKFSLSSEFIKVQSKGFVAMDIKTKDNLHKISEYSGTWISEEQRQFVLNKLGWTTV